VNLGTVLIEEAELAGHDLAGFKIRGLFKKKAKRPALVASVAAAKAAKDAEAAKAAQAKRLQEEQAAIAAARAQAQQSPEYYAAIPDEEPEILEPEELDPWTDPETLTEEVGNPWGGRAHELGDLAGLFSRKKKKRRKAAAAAAAAKAAEEAKAKTAEENRAQAARAAAYVTPATAKPGDPDAWASEARDEAELSGIWDSVKGFFTAAPATGAPASQAPAAKAASSGGLSSWIDKAVGVANSVIDLKAKARNARNGTVANAFNAGAISRDQAIRLTGGDVTPEDKRPWTERDSLINGVPNLWIAGGAAGVLALVLVMKKRQA